MDALGRRGITVSIPSWVELRSPPWKFAGWISCDPILDLDFDEAVQRSLGSDHGEIREVDYYNEGAVTWWKEA